MHDEVRDHRAVGRFSFELFDHEAFCIETARQAFQLCDLAISRIVRHECVWREEALIIDEDGVLMLVGKHDAERAILWQVKWAGCPLACETVRNSRQDLTADIVVDCDQKRFIRECYGFNGLALVWCEHFPHITQLTIFQHRCIDRDEATGREVQFFAFMLDGPVFLKRHKDEVPL